MNERNNPEDNVRKDRKLKKLYSKIRKQMEFYFSDSNLVRDKFLIDLISKDSDGYVELEVFKNFNKVKALTNSCEIIATSVSRSAMFEVSEDRKRIRRVTPLELSKDFDACILFVENLPQNADLKWIKDVFGQFGTIMHVNVPRYKITNRIKGFAFVEYENPEGVKNACEFYKIVEKECSASEDESKIAKNAKKHKHDEVFNDKKNKKSRTRSVSESSDKLTDFSSLKSEQHQDVSDKDADHDQDHWHQKGKRKRRREDSGGESQVITLKRPKESINKDLSTSATNSTDESKMEQPCAATEVNLIQPEEQMMADDGRTEVSNNCLNGTNTEKDKSKKRRKNAKKYRLNVERPTLKVMPKSEWKVFRNKYLELQRSTMSIIKKQILFESQKLKEQEGNVKSTDAFENKKSVNFIPDVIVKVKLTEPVKNQAEIKTQVKANAVVAYVDAPVESADIFIRCHNSEDANSIIKEEKLAHLGKAELIKGDEEKKYWEKIENDRKTKFNNPVKHKRKGRDKLYAKAAKLEEMKNKHIYFDD